MTRNTNPRCKRCDRETYGAGQWCSNHGDNVDIGIIIVQEDNQSRDYTRARRQYDEEQMLPGFEAVDRAEA